MTTNSSHPEPGSSPAAATTRHEPKALAEAAWRHLVNRHQLAQVLDQLGFSIDDTAQLSAAVANLAQRLDSRPACPVHPTIVGDPQ